MHDVPKDGSILLGKYRVVRMLGRGGMGFVVAARHEELGNLVAIKFMLPERVKFKDARERFVREARASACLTGEHVTHVYDIGTLDNGAPYMLMEHLTGDNFRDILDKRGVLPVHEAALYVYQACEAIAEAHGHGIAHRDLKPANLFFTRRPNGTPCVKVLDFGISKNVEGGQTLTKKGMPVGTPIYMAPEQLVGTKTTDLRSDIWALGIILYELVIGKPPFHAVGVMELFDQVLESSPVPPSHVRPGIPVDFDAIVLRCLEKQADQRFASVRELMTALQPFTTANSSQPVMGLQDPPAALGEAVKDPTTVEWIKRAETHQPPPPTIPGYPLLPIVPIAPDQAAIGVGAGSASMHRGVNPGPTDGGFSGTTRVFPDKRKKPWGMVAAASGGAALIIAIVFVATRSTAAPVVPPESAAPAVSAPPATTSLADSPTPISTTPETVPPVAPPQGTQPLPTPTTDRKKTPPRPPRPTPQRINKPTPYKPPTPQRNIKPTPYEPTPYKPTHDVPPY